MLDIKLIRSDKEKVVEGLKKRHGEFPIDDIIKLDGERRELITIVETKKAEQNQVSKSVGQLKKEGEDLAPIFAKMKELSNEIKSYDEKIRVIETDIENKLLFIPNIPDQSVPEGLDDSENIEIRKFGEPRKFDFEPKAHWDLGVDLGILDFERASKISGARFSVFKGLGAKLERSIYTFMLDTHTENGKYTELSVPYLVNRSSMTGTGQLPKFEEDAFHIPSKDFFLVPTAEVPVTNFRKDEIISNDELPLNYTAYTACFRQEAGSAGRDTRGLIRNHQFDKVELVKLVKPEDSFDELEKLTADAEKILQLLNIPYRVVLLSSGDLGFSSAKTYDIEVWMPSYNRYVEISSCSNFVDFQARRANLKFRDEDGKVKLVHTLNGSGLAVGRTFAAILENYQNEDGSVTVPEVLKSYLKVDKIEA
ncbi:MAG: serine--tRNA ligase [Helcococcus sp.]|nr:serine--tRNA ligase [Helcococcus sp.]